MGLGRHAQCHLHRRGLTVALASVLTAQQAQIRLAAVFGPFSNFPGANQMAPLPPYARDPLIRAYLALSTPNVSDALDRLEINGAPLGIVPLWPGAKMLVGRALTMKLLPIDQGSASPVLGTLQAIMAGQPGDVLVIDQAGRTDVNSLGR